MIEAKMAPCIPTTFQRAILSEHDIVSSRCPCTEQKSAHEYCNMNRAYEATYLYDAIPCLNAITALHWYCSFTGFNFCA